MIIEGMLLVMVAAVAPALPRLADDCNTVLAAAAAEYTEVCERTPQISHPVVSQRVLARIQRHY